MTVTLDYLADHHELAPTLARWHVDQWRVLLPNWTYEAALKELQTHTQRCHLPTTRVAFIENEPVGSASLIVEDHDEITDFSPWLASVYVLPTARRRGVGEELVHAICVDARALEISTLYLYTEDRADWYRRLGWMLVREQRLKNERLVSIMSTKP